MLPSLGGIRPVSVLRRVVVTSGLDIGQMVEGPAVGLAACPRSGEAGSVVDAAGKVPTARMHRGRYAAICPGVHF